MMKIYCNVCNKYRIPKISYILKKTWILFIVCNKCDHEYKNMFKEEESTEILKVLGLITNKEYLKIYNHVWRKHKSRI